MNPVIVTGVPRPALADLDALAPLGVATVHEALGRTGYLGPGLRPVQQGARIAGSAVTALCWPGDNLMIHAAVEQCQEGDVLVVTTTSPCTDGLFGELFATALRYRGVRGVVTTTGIRDTACVDAGMPVVLLDAADFGVTGRETPRDLEADEELAARLARVRQAALPLMGLDPGATTVPKLALVAPPHAGGSAATRCFIPVRCHEAIGALAAVSVGAGLLLDGAVGRKRAQLPPPGEPLRLEHPTGHLDVAVDLEPGAGPPRLRRSGVVRTARKIFDGTVFPAAPRPA